MNENAKNTYIQLIYNEDKTVTKEELLNELNVNKKPNKRINKKQYVDTKFVEADIDNWMRHVISQTHRKLNYSGLNQLIPKEVAPIIPVSMIKATLKADTVQQITAQKKKVAGEGQGHITSLLPNEIWQVDILVKNIPASKAKNYKYVLCAIDVFTRKAWLDQHLIMITVYTNMTSSM